MAFRLRTLAFVALGSCLVGAGTTYLVLSRHVAELDRTIAADQVAQDTARAQYRSDLGRLGRDLATAQDRATRAERASAEAVRQFADYRAEVGRVVSQGLGFAQNVSRDSVTNLSLVDRCLEDLERYLESPTVYDASVDKTEADLQAQVSALAGERDLWRLGAVGAGLVALASLVWAAVK